MKKKMSYRDLLDRTHRFAAETLRLCAALPKKAEVGIVKRQLLRAATSVGANYRAARRARSRREFVARLSVVEEEADECVYWLDLLALATLKVAPAEQVLAQRNEASELIAIVVASKKTAQRRGL